MMQCEETRRTTEDRQELERQIKTLQKDIEDNTTKCKVLPDVLDGWNKDLRKLRRLRNDN